MAIKFLNNNLAEATHIYFQRIGKPNPRAVTDVWHVYSGNAHTPSPLMLGHVAWFGAWRKYCYYPNGATVYEETCLREIAEFVVTITTQHKTSRRGEGPNA